MRAKGYMLRAKSWIMVLGGLALLAVVGVLLGWSARAVTSQLAPETPDSSAVRVLATPTATPDATADMPPDVLPPTSTLDNVEALIVVKPGETLYQICRRFCPDNWAVGSLPEDLRIYAQQVAERNGLSWSAGSSGPLIKPGDTILMLPCPPR